MATRRPARIVASVALILALTLAQLARLPVPASAGPAVGAVAPYTIADIGTFSGGRRSAVLDINSAGQVIGGADVIINNEVRRHAFLWEHGVLTDLTPGAYYGLGVLKINDQGQILLSTADGAALRQVDGTVTNLALGSLGGGETAPADFNAGGQIVGSSLTAPQPYVPSETHPFLWQVGRMTDLGALPGGTYGAATAINAGGTVVGWSTVCVPDPS